MEQKYKITIEKENFLYNTLSIIYCKRVHLLFNIRSILSKVFKEYDIDKSNIQSLNITQKGKNVHIKVKYCEVNLQTLTRSTDKKEQIIITLNHLGYPLKKIRKIEQQKKWSKCAEDNQMF